jgi:hypothetical protein
MARTGNIVDNSIYQAALEGLELQKQRIEDQIIQVRGLLAGKTKPVVAAAANAPKPAVAKAAKKQKKRKLSDEARERIAEAQKKRWAAFRETQAS